MARMPKVFARSGPGIIPLVVAALGFGCAARGTSVNPDSGRATPSASLQASPFGALGAEVAGRKGAAGVQAPDSCSSDGGGGVHGRACLRTANTVAVDCLSGECAVVTCAGGFGDCDGLYANGCEVDLFASINQCGNCVNAVCPIPKNALTAVCLRSVPGCAPGTCAAGFAHCTNLPNDGCETRIATDEQNCGDCGAACPATFQMTPGCVGGACQFSCRGEYYDVDARAENGCERQDSPLGNHSLATAAKLPPVPACNHGEFTGQIIGYLPADRRGHENLPVRSNGTLEDWYALTPLGEAGCDRDLDFGFWTSGGSGTERCFRATFFSNQGSWPLTTSGTGGAALGNQSAAYSVPSTIYVKIEKLTSPIECARAANEDVLYVINYHL
jgi:hypothetical protein